MFIEETVGRVEGREKGNHIVSDRSTLFPVPPHPTLPELNPGDPIALVFFGEWNADHTVKFKTLFGARTLTGSCPADYEAGPVYYDARSKLDFLMVKPGVINALETLLYDFDPCPNLKLPVIQHTP